MDADKVTALLYIILRDEMTFGTMEDIFQKHIDILDNQEIIFTNKHAQYQAEDFMKRLK